nr:hypothetical protein JVH1_9351 [Rhodococcus sp. JVH1]
MLVTEVNSTVSSSWTKRWASAGPLPLPLQQLHTIGNRTKAERLSERRVRRPVADPDRQPHRRRRAELHTKPLGEHLNPAEEVDPAPNGRRRRWRTRRWM